MKQEQEVDQDESLSDTGSDEDRKMSAKQESEPTVGGSCANDGERGEDDEDASVKVSLPSQCAMDNAAAAAAAQDPNGDQQEQKALKPTSESSPASSSRGHVARSDRDAGTASRKDTSSCPPPSEIESQQPDGHEKDDNDPDFLLKLIQRRQQLQQTQDSNEAPMGPSVASIPAAASAAPSVVAAAPSRVRRAPSISKSNQSYNGICRRRSRSMSAESHDEDNATNHQYMSSDRQSVSPDSAEDVGAFAISCSADSHNSTSSTTDELGTSQDIPSTGRIATSATDTTVPPQESAPLAIAAEVAPEMIDLERSITDRLRREITEQVVYQNSLNGEDSVVIAEIVQTLKEECEEDEEERQRKRVKLLIAILAVVGILAIVVGPVVDHFLTGQTTSSNFPPDPTVLAQVNETICYERLPLLGRSELDVCPPQPQGSGVTNLVAASRLWNIVDAQLSILNAGEVRLDLEQVDFTMGEARQLLPFVENELIMIHIQGSQLVAAMERGIQKLFDDKAAADSGLNSSTPSGAYPYGAGIRWSVNMTAPFPKRLYDIQVNPRMSFDWEPINLHQVYTVVTTSYLQAGGDSYHEFSAVEEEHVIHTGLYSLEAFVGYCQGREILVEPPLEFYSTQTYIHNPVLFDIPK